MHLFHSGDNYNYMFWLYNVLLFQEHALVSCINLNIRLYWFHYISINLVHVLVSSINSSIVLVSDISSRTCTDFRQKFKYL